MSRMARAAWLWMALLTACAGTPARSFDGGPPDAGERDASVVDAGARDAGDDARDGGLDAGVERDGGSRDAGLDAGASDAAPSDAGPWPYDDVPSSPPTRTCEPARSFPRTAGVPFTLGGQTAFFHDEGHSYGFFHTYDGLVACAGAAPRKTHVLLPRDYETSGRRYPVLYVNDGQTAFFTDNPVGRTWDLAAVLSELRRCGEVEDIVVVAPHPLDRDAEYSHARATPTSGCCQVDAYAEYLRSCLGAFVERHYRVRTGPDETAILGSSRGGLAAFWVGTTAPVRYGHVAALSPSFWVGLDDRATGARGPTSLADSALYAHARPVLASDARPSLWIDWGLVRDGGDHNRIIEAMATDRGREMVELLERDLGMVRTGFDRASGLVAIEDPDGAHDEDSWRVRVAWVLRWMFPAP